MPEITFDEARFAARPARLRPRARRRQGDESPITPPFEPSGTNRAYVEWLEEQSMLHDAQKVARQLAGSHTMWSNPYAHPDPRAAVQRASVWYTAYPLSHDHRARPVLPRRARLGRAVGGVRRRSASTPCTPARSSWPAGIDGWELTPSVDGHFDRMSHGRSTRCSAPRTSSARCARWPPAHNGTIIDDIVPGHTGKGADFRLAELNYRDYPGIYHMVDIPEAAWHLLPDVPEGRDSVNLDAGGGAGAGRRGLHHRRAAARDLLRAGRQGDQLVGHAAGPRLQGHAAPLGLPALLQGGPARRSTGWTPPSPACGW